MLDLANIVMVFLLAVVFAAVRYGRGPAVLAAFLSVGAFDFLYVPPRFSFSVSDVQYVVTFAVMLVVALVIGQMTAGLKFQARVAMHREARSRALYEFARELSGALQTEQIFETTRAFIQRTFRAKATLILPDDNGRLQPPSINPGDESPAPNLSVLDMGYRAMGVRPSDAGRHRHRHAAGQRPCSTCR